MAVSPNVGSFIQRRFGCGSLLWRSLIRNVARKASSVTLTTGMVVTPVPAGWSVLIRIPSEEPDRTVSRSIFRRTNGARSALTFISKRLDSLSPLIGAKLKTISASYSEATGWLNSATVRPHRPAEADLR